MIDSLKPYPVYKDSGVPWLGEVPGHWIVTRLGALGRFSSSGIDKKTLPNESLVRMVNYLDVYRNATHELRSDMELMKVSCTDSKKIFHDVRVGDMLFTPSSETSDDIGWSAVAMETLSETVYSYHLVRFRADDPGDLRFRRYWCNNPFVLNQFSQASRGTTRKILDRGDFRRIVVALPPAEEQVAIGRFLDWANGQLERAIQATRKIIALLNEQKQAIIHHAVTRGLDPNVRLKKSGIPWLGEIPEHWEIRPLKQLLIQMDYGTSESTYAEGKVRVLTMGNIKDGKIMVPKSGGLDAVPAGLQLETNDLLFNRTNSPDLVGKVGIFEGEVSDEISFASYLVRLRVHLDYRAHWLNFLLNSTRFWAFARSHALVSLHQANLNSTRYGRMLIPVPPKKEQDKIISHIFAWNGEIDKIISRTEREISLLREYRTRLITDVVTGKVDVREAAARLPVEVDRIEETDQPPDTDEVTEELEEAGA